MAKSEARAALDNYIADASAHLQSLKDIRNEYCEISVLPPEVLGLILAARFRPPHDDDDDREFECFTWRDRVSLSSVCRRWREVALQTPAFWAHIPPSASPHFEEMLSRSKQAPFSVRIGGQIIEETEGLADALKSICVAARLQEFHAYGSEEELESCLSFFPEKPTPILTSLRMESSYNAIIPPHVLTGSKPNLQRIHIESCQVPWHALGSIGRAPLFPHLSHLCLIQATPRPPPQFLMNIITCSNLEYLQLDGSTPDNLPNFNTAADSPTQLRSLTEFIIHDDALHFIQLYAHVSLPEAKPIIHVEDPVQGVTLQEETDILKSFLDICGCSDTPNRARTFALTSLDIRYQSAWPVGGEGGILMSAGRTFRVAFSHGAVPSVLRTLSAGEELKTVTINTRRGDTGSGHDWTYLFQRHPCITTLTVEGEQNAVEGLTDVAMFYALDPTFNDDFTLHNPSSVRNPHEEGDEGQTSERPRKFEEGHLSSDQRVQLLPNLSHLSLTGLIFDGITHEPGVLPPPSLFGRILDTLAARRAKGVRVPSIHLTRIKMLSAEMLEQLKDVVGAGRVTLQGTELVAPRSRYPDHDFNEVF